MRGQHVHQRAAWLAGSVGAWSLAARMRLRRADCSGSQHDDPRTMPRFAPERRRGGRYRKRVGGIDCRFIAWVNQREIFKGTTSSCDAFASVFGPWSSFARSSLGGSHLLCPQPSLDALQLWFQVNKLTGFDLDPLSTDV